MPLGLGLGLGGLPGLGMLGAGGLGGVDFNAIATYQQAQAQALAVQSQIAAGLYPGFDLASLAAAAHSTPTSDAKQPVWPPRRPTGSSSQRTVFASASESDFESGALWPSRAPVPPPVVPGPVGLPRFGAAVGTGMGDKRSVVPLKSAPPTIKKEDSEIDEGETTRLPPPRT